MVFKKFFLNFNNNNRHKLQLQQVGKELKHQKMKNKKNRDQFRSQNRKYSKKDKTNVKLNPMLIKVGVLRIILELWLIQIKFKIYNSNKKINKSLQVKNEIRLNKSFDNN